MSAPAGTATFNPGTATSTAITVTGLPGFAHLTAATGLATAFVQTNGFNASTTPEVFDLQLAVGGVTPTQTQIGQVIQDINSGSSTDGLTASTQSFTNLTATGPGYNVMLTENVAIFAPPASGTSYLGFDFSQETNVAGVTVENIAAVPEPVTATGLVIAGGSLILRRRRNTVV